MSALDHLLSAVAAGRVSRRDFVARAAALGISATAIAEMTRVLDARAEAEAAGINSLTLNAVQVFGNIDPAIGIDYTQNMANINFYDTLLTPTPAASVTGRLAQSYTGSRDARTFTFYLRKGVTFHSGREVTADDVVYSMQRVMAIGQGPAFDQLEHEIGGPVVIAVVEDFEDVRMLQAGDRSRLLLEAFAVVGLVGEEVG